MRFNLVFLFIQWCFVLQLTAQKDGNGSGIVRPKAGNRVFEAAPDHKSRTINVKDTIMGCPANWIIQITDDTVSGMYFKYFFYTRPDERMINDFEAYAAELSKTLGKPASEFIDSEALYRGNITRESPQVPLIVSTWNTRHGLLKLGIYSSGNNPEKLMPGGRWDSIPPNGKRTSDYYVVWLNSTPAGNTGATKDWKIYTGMSKAALARLYPGIK